jgi:hypothetical protein
VALRDVGLKVSAETPAASMECCTAASLPRDVAEPAAAGHAAFIPLPGFVGLNNELCADIPDLAIS